MTNQNREKLDDQGTVKTKAEAERPLQVTEPAAAKAPVYKQMLPRFVEHHRCEFLTKAGRRCHMDSAFEWYWWDAPTPCINFTCYEHTPVKERKEAAL